EGRSAMANGTMMLKERLALGFEVVERRISGREWLPGRQGVRQKLDPVRRELGGLKRRHIVQQPRLGSDGALGMVDQRGECLRLERRLAAIQLVWSGDGRVQHRRDGAPKAYLGRIRVVHRPDEFVTVGVGRQLYRNPDKGMLAEICKIGSAVV